MQPSYIYFGVLVALAVAGVLYLAAQLVLALKKLEPQKRRGLFPLGIALAALALLLFGGDVLLGVVGFAWRTNALWGLAIALWLAGWGAGICTAVATGRRVRAAGGKSGIWSGLCWVSLVWSMLMGTLCGAFWLYDHPADRVGTLEGARWVETEFFEEYALYPYMGPLIRSTSPVQTSEHPILRELYGADTALGLDLSAGEVVLASDNHGGLQGDGDTWVVLQFPDEGIESQLQDWEPLPLTGDALTAVERKGENGWTIPTAGEGCWHWETRNGLNNFTLAVWDRSRHQLIYWRFDL